MAESQELGFLWGIELEASELALIGSIVAQWGALEHEVFIQTLATFELSAEGDLQLPKAMNNIKFSEVLSLWKARVIEKASSERAQVLTRQHEAIVELQERRNALVHGMWEWSPSDLKQIVTMRIKKMSCIATIFIDGDLGEFEKAVSRINFNIRFPLGQSEYLEHKANEMNQGGWMSRSFTKLMSGTKLNQN